MIFSIYIHIPFCTEKCEYCDFFSVPSGVEPDRRLLKKILDNIIAETEQKIDLIPDPELSSIFIGGGTPSIIPPDILHDFLNKLKKITHGLIKDDIEFTTEANVESCSTDFLDAAADGGINRLSVGVQSFNKDTLQQIGRAAYPEDVFGSVSRIGEQWKGSLSLDIISGINTDYPEDIKKAVMLKPEHLSVYQLTVEEGTRLAELVLSGQKSAPDEQLQAEAIENVNRNLETSGYLRYEISNFSLKGMECRHNLGYWNMQTYIGAGPSAVSSLYLTDGRSCRRLTNPCNFNHYLEMDKIQTEELTELDFIFEHYIMGCRLINGINQDIFKRRFGCSSFDLIPETLEQWLSKGMIDSETRNLNSSGLMLLDLFLTDVYSELEKK